MQESVSMHKSPTQLRHSLLNLGRPEDKEKKERKRNKKDKGQEADGKKGSPTKQKPIWWTKTRPTCIAKVNKSGGGTHNFPYSYWMGPLSPYFIVTISFIIRTNPHWPLWAMMWISLSFVSNFLINITLIKMLRHPYIWKYYWSSEIHVHVFWIIKKFQNKYLGTYIKFSNNILISEAAVFIKFALITKIAEKEMEGP